MSKTFAIVAGCLLAALLTAPPSLASPAAHGGHFSHMGGMGRGFRPFAQSHRDFDHRDFNHRDFNHRDFDHRRARRNDFSFWGWPYGWGDYYDQGQAYPVEEQPLYSPPPPLAQPAAPICPELWHWDDKLGRATRQKLCE